MSAAAKPQTQQADKIQVTVDISMGDVMEPDTGSGLLDTTIGGGAVAATTLHTDSAGGPREHFVSVIVISLLLY